MSNFNLSDKSMRPLGRAPRDPVREDSCYVKIASAIAHFAHFFTLEKKAFEEDWPCGPYAFRRVRQQ